MDGAATPLSKTPGATTDRLRAALLDCQRRVLQRIADGAPLEDVLETLVRLIEEQEDEMRCALLLADAAQKRLHFVAAPQLSADFKRAVDPRLAIAPDMANCGAAACLRQPVYTRDTASDPRWKGYAEIAARAGLRAVWSTPILSDENQVLGTFAMFYAEPRLPSGQHIQLIDMAVQMARVAIEAKRDEEMLRAVFESAPDAMLITDLAGEIVDVNPAFATLLGYAPGELRGRQVTEITEEKNHSALVDELVSLGQKEIANDRRYLRKNGTVVPARAHSGLRRDARSVPRYVFTRVEQSAPVEAHLLGQLSRRERQVFELVVSGLTSKEIAARFGISARSVDTYRSRIMAKLKIENLPALVSFAIRTGIRSV